MSKATRRSCLLVIFNVTQEVSKKTQGRQPWLNLKSGRERERKPQAICVNKNCLDTELLHLSLLVIFSAGAQFLTLRSPHRGGLLQIPSFNISDFSGSRRRTPTWLKEHQLTATTPRREMVNFPTPWECCFSHKTALKEEGSALSALYTRVPEPTRLI